MPSNKHSLHVEGARWKAALRNVLSEVFITPCNCFPRSSPLISRIFPCHPAVASTTYMDIPFGTVDHDWLLRIHCAYLTHHALMRTENRKRTVSTCEFFSEVRKTYEHSLCRLIVDCQHLRRSLAQGQGVGEWFSLKVCYAKSEVIVRSAINERTDPV